MPQPDLLFGDDERCLAMAGLLLVSVPIHGCDHPATSRCARASLLHRRSHHHWPVNQAATEASPKLPAYQQS